MRFLFKHSIKSSISEIEPFLWLWLIINQPQNAFPGLQNKKETLTSIFYFIWFASTMTMATPQTTTIRILRCDQTDFLSRNRMISTGTPSGSVLTWSRPAAACHISQFWPSEIPFSEKLRSFSSRSFWHQIVKRKPINIAMHERLAYSSVFVVSFFSCAVPSLSCFFSFPLTGTQLFLGESRSSYQNDTIY